MGEKNRLTLKTYFELGDNPSEAQFIDLLDSSPTYSDDSPSGSASADFDFDIAADRMLDTIVFHADSGINSIKVGDSLGSSEYADDTITIGTPLVLDLAIFAITTKTIYVEVTGTVNYKYFLK